MAFYTGFLNSLAINLLRLIGQSQDYSKNVIFSPHSLYTCLGTLELSSQGQTKTEFLSVLGYDFNNPEYQSILQDKLQFTLNRAINYNCYVFVNKRLNETYQSYVNTTLNAHVHPLNMSNSVGAANAINQCINRSTVGLIPWVVNDCDISPQDNIFLLNAVYFREMWDMPFRMGNSDNFYLSDGNTVQVTYMDLSASLKYYRDNAKLTTMIGLPYSNKRFFGLVIFPDASVNISDYWSSFTLSDYTAIFDNWQDTNVQLKFPKFDLSDSRSLTSYLKGLGLNTAFDQYNAEFPFLSPQPTYMSKVAHRARLILNEQSTVAAVGDLLRLPSRVVGQGFTPVTVNRPFIFSIYDSYSQSMLITSLIADPSDTTPLEPPAGCDDGTTASTERPHSSSERPHSSTEEPEHTSERPHSSSERPHSSTEEPEHTSERPHSSTEEPEHTSERTSSSTEEPENTSERTSSSTEKPEETTTGGNQDSTTQNSGGIE